MHLATQSGPGGPTDAAAAPAASAPAAAASAPVDGRTALLRATIAVGLGRGLGAVTSRAVAEEAGLAHSLVRYHFGSVDAMLTEALALAIDESLHDTRGLSGSASLRDLTRSLSEAVREHRDSYAFLHEALLESRRRPQLRPQVERYYSEYRTGFARQLERLGVVEPELIDVAWFALEGLIFKEISSPSEPERAQATIRRLRQIVLVPSGVLDAIDPDGLDAEDAAGEAPTAAVPPAAG